MLRAIIRPVNKKTIPSSRKMKLYTFTVFVPVGIISIAKDKSIKLKFLRMVFFPMKLLPRTPPQLHFIIFFFFKLNEINIVNTNSKIDSPSAPIHFVD